MTQSDSAVRELIRQARRSARDWAPFDAFTGLAEAPVRTPHHLDAAIRVLVAQRGKLLCGAMAAMLTRTPDMTVVAQSPHGDEVVSAAHREAVDIAVIDCELPCSIPITELCEKLFPQCTVLLLCDPESTDRLCFSLARSTPQVGFIATESSPDMLIDSVRRAARGETVIDTKLALSLMIASQNPLTDRELEVLRLAAEGLRTNEIAQRIFLSPGTVRNHLSRILTKTDSRTRIAAIRAAHQRGWI